MLQTDFQQKRNVKHSYCSQTWKWKTVKPFFYKKAPKKTCLQRRMVWLQRFELFFPKRRQYGNTVMPLCAHRRLSLSPDKDGPASPQAIMYPQKGFWQKKKKNIKNVPHFTPTSTAAFNMWNTSSTNPELVLSRFLRSACNLSQLGFYTDAWIYPIRRTCAPTCTHAHTLKSYRVTHVGSLCWFFLSVI